LLSSPPQVLEKDAVARLEAQGFAGHQVQAEHFLNLR
jgi:hypothetical protein